MTPEIAGEGVQRRALLLIACTCVLMAVLSAIVMEPRSFSLLSPFPLLPTVAWIILVGGNTRNADLSRMAAALIIPMLFMLWSLPLFRGASVIPARSKWAAMILAALSCAYFGWFAKYGFMFQGSAHTF